MNDDQTNEQPELPFDAESVISEILEEQAAPEAPEQPQEPEPENADQAEGAQSDAPAAEEPEPAEQPAELLSPVLAERSKQERARREFEASFEQKLADARAEAQAEVIKALKANPSSFIEQHKIDNADDLALHFYAAALGDEAPEELKQQLGKTEADRRVATLEAKLEAFEAKMISQREIERSQAVLDQYSAVIADVPSDLKYFGVEASANSEEMLTAMAKVADQLHQETGAYPGALEVAKILDSAIADQAAKYAALTEAKPSEPDSTSTVQPVKETETLTNELSGRAAEREQTSEDDNFEAALKMLESMTAD